jgi:hypothetical protein
VVKLRNAQRLDRRVDQRDGGIDELDGVRRLSDPGVGVRGAGQQRGAVDARNELGVGDDIPEGERSRVVTRGLGERTDALGLAASANGGGQGTRLVACTQPMVGDLSRDGGGIATCQVRIRLQGSGEGSVELRALAGEQFAVRDLLEQCVAEREPPFVSKQDVMSHRCPERVAERRLGESGRDRQQPVVDLPTTGRRNPHHGLRRGVERRDPRQQNVAQRPGQAIGRAALAGRHQLLGEERIAPGASEDVVDEIGRRRRPEDPRDLLAQRGTLETCELDAPCARSRGDLGQEAPQAVAPVDLVVAIGGDDEDLLGAQAACEERQEVERGPVRPVDVLEDEQHRSVRRRHTEPVEHRGVHARCRSGDELRGGRACRQDMGRIAVAGPGQGLGHRQQRDDRVIECGALPPHHARCVVGPRGELRHQPALADASLATDEHNARCAVDRAVHRRDELPQLGRAPREDTAREALAHVPSIAPWAARAVEIRRCDGGEYGVLPMADNGHGLSFERLVPTTWRSS